MTSDADRGWVYNQTVKMFATPGDPPFEDAAELTAHWGRAWGVNNDVGGVSGRFWCTVRGPKWRWLTLPNASKASGLSVIWKRAGISKVTACHPWPACRRNTTQWSRRWSRGGGEVHHVDGVENTRLKSCYTCDPLIMVNGGAIICRIGTRVRQGEKLSITRTLARLGIPILRTLSGSALMEGGSFA